MTDKPSVDELMQKIRNALTENFGIDPTVITAKARMRDIGVDSLHVVEILLDLEAELGVKLTDFGFPPNPSLEEVAQVIDKNISQKA